MTYGKGVPVQRDFLSCHERAFRTTDAVFVDTSKLEISCKCVVFPAAFFRSPDVVFFYSVLGEFGACLYKENLGYWIE